MAWSPDLDSSFGYAVRPAAEIWSAMDGAPMKGMGSYFRASPLSTGTDGFFTAIVERRNSRV